MNIQKALDTASGAKLIPERLDPVLVELADKETPLRMRFKKVPWDTNSYEWNVRSALVGADFYNESTGFSASNSTYARRTASIKMLKSEGAVSNLLVSTSKSYINALQAEIESATKNIAQKEEWAFLNGDSGVSSDQIDGLEVQITQEEDAVGNPLSLDILDAAINQVIVAGGKPSLILLSNRDMNALNKIMRDKMSYDWKNVEQSAGTRVANYQGIPVIGSLFAPTNKTYGTTPVSTYSVGYVLDESEIVVPMVKDVSYEEVATSTDSIAFRLKMYFALAVRAKEKQCKITNLAKPT